jgi:hypothetical protein
VKTSCAGNVVKPRPLSRNNKTGIQDSMPLEEGWEVKIHELCGI